MASNRFGGCTMILIIIFVLFLFYSILRNPNPKIHREKITPTGKGFHFVFNIDCNSHRNTFHYMSFTLFYSFISMYGEDSGNTMTELISCKDLTFKPVWESKLPSHCHTIVVPDFHFFKPNMEPRHEYLPYNKPSALIQLLDGPWKDKDDDSVIVIIDPDFIFLRPLSPLFLYVADDEVINGFYLISNWADYYKEFKNIQCANCEKYNNEEKVGFQAGVPNIMRLSTLRKIAQPWWDWTYIFRDSSDNNWQDEQLGYIYALVDQDVKSSTREDLFVSGVDETGLSLPFTFLHYCQSYVLDKGWIFSKHELMKKNNEEGIVEIDRPIEKPVFTCDSSPVDVPIWKTGEITQGYAYYSVTRYLNGAWKYWKQLFCNGPRVI
jgi:hypothetical protein